MDLSALASYLPAMLTTRVSASSASNPPTTVDLLILGAGWTASFLIPLLRKDFPQLLYASTTRHGGGEYGSIPFTFDPTASEGDERDGKANQWKKLPEARNVLITFPITVEGGARKLVAGYIASKHQKRAKDKMAPLVRFIQLGSTGAFTEQAARKAGQAPSAGSSFWLDRHSPLDTSNDRVKSENEFLALSGSIFPSVSPQGSGSMAQTTVFNLAGLHGGARQPRNWLPRVFPIKDKLIGKGSLHLIHGLDVSRAIIGAILLDVDVQQAHKPPGWRFAGQRWLATDGRIYDWWDLAWAWSSPPPAASKDPWPYSQWVQELMREEGVRALPRDSHVFGRCLDSREFWEALGTRPSRAGVGAFAE